MFVPSKAIPWHKARSDNSTSADVVSFSEPKHSIQQGTPKLGDAMLHMTLHQDGSKMPPP